MKKTYWLPCECGQRLPVTTTQAGETLRCSCGAELVVPPLHDMRNLESAADREAVRGKAGKPTWDKRQSRILLCAVITVVFLGSLLCVAYRKPRPPRMESLAPIQVWYVWQTLRRGPDRNLAPLEKKFIENVRVNRNIKIALMVCSAAGLLIMAIYYAIPAPRMSRPMVRNRTVPQTSPSGEEPNAHL